MSKVVSRQLGRIHSKLAKCASGRPISPQRGFGIGSLSTVQGVVLVLQSKQASKAFSLLLPGQVIVDITIVFVDPMQSSDRTSFKLYQAEEVSYCSIF